MVLPSKQVEVPSDGLDGHASAADRLAEEEGGRGFAVAGAGPGERLPASAAEQTHDTDGN